MRLIDIDNIDYVILEDSLHKIKHKKGDEIDCVIGAEIVPAVPIKELIKLRDKIQKLHDDTDAKAKAQEPYKGINEKADLACFLYRNDFIKPLNDLIKQYGFKEKEEEEYENNSLRFNEEELQDICMTCSYAYELIRDDGYTREEVVKKLSFDKYLFFALQYMYNLS